jgi:hypothetical protein
MMSYELPVVMGPGLLLYRPNELEPRLADHHAERPQSTTICYDAIDVGFKPGWNSLRRNH